MNIHHRVDGRHSAASELDSLLAAELDGLRLRDMFRKMHTLEGAQDSWVEVAGRRVLNLCSNNYLGLASYYSVRDAAARGAMQWGAGSGSSRLICGNMSAHEALEARLAVFKGTEAALAYTSGYTANLGAISSLVGKEDFVFSDRLNHASLVDGCRLSQAKVVVFPHRDLAALECEVQSVLDSFPESRRLIITDAVFSMDGDLAPLKGLAQIAERHGCILMVDEAHSTGVLGPGGRGLVAGLGLEDRVPVVMGTLSKALGGFGGFICGSRTLRDYLVNTARSFIFTTGLPPGAAVAALAALDALEGDPGLPQRVQLNAAYLRGRLKSLGFETLDSETQIIPIVIGGAAPTMEMSRLLLGEGVLAPAVRPPTVPEGTSRVRVSVMATHSREDLDFAVSAFEKAGQRLGVI